MTSLEEISKLHKKRKGKFVEEKYEVWLQLMVKQQFGKKKKGTSGKMVILCWKENYKRCDKRELIGKRRKEHKAKRHMKEDYKMER